MFTWSLLRRRKGRSCDVSSLYVTSFDARTARETDFIWNVKVSSGKLNDMSSNQTLNEIIVTLVRSKKLLRFVYFISEENLIKYNI